SADKQTVTLIASQAIPDWTEWLSASESSNMIYSSKPYDASSSGHTGSGQFVVDVSEIVYLRARVKAAMPTGTVTVRKSSADPAMTDGNASYSLAGAKYGLYTDSACTEPARDADGNDAVLTTGADGSSDTLTLNAGTYYIKEISPSPGYGLAGGVYPVTLAYNENLSLSAADSSIFREPPLNDPMALFIRKTPAAEYSGAEFDMSGAQYTVRYYAGQYTKETLPAEADAVWVIETKKTGNLYAAYLAEGYVVSGSPVYGTNAGGGYIIPLGTLTVEETKAPAGFKIEGSTLQLLNGDGTDASDGVVLFNLVDQNSTVSVISGNRADGTEEGVQILQKETVASVNVGVEKTSDDGRVSGLSFTLSGTLLAGGTYSETKATDENGAIDFGDVPYGTYTLTEDLTEDQAKIYLPNDPVSFTIDENTPNPYRVSFHNGLKRGSIVTEAKNNATGTHEGLAVSETVITDFVTYTALVPGAEYTLKGILMDKETGSPLLVDGREVTAEIAFTPEEADGTAEQYFVFSSELLGGRTVVVFEILYREGTEVAAHADLNDEDQTVVFRTEEETETEPAGTPPTGDPSDIMIPAAVMAAAGMGIALILFWKRRGKGADRY
ncbi:MAG: VaFE repeat-containing surface-anchored protein, partial [Lachnospiraceae bacterium]|nr:VaFE repeat-containing surface-anchored protein [Lachnospiraceae bacterium]